MRKICIIIPYFGNLPRIFDFWMHSALNNPTIDFLLLTDCNVKSINNVKVFPFSFEEMQAHIQKFFDFPIALKQPYKLCDYKGAYGYVFQEYIKDYDFWGFGDIDLIYGDMRRFITEDVLEKYDVISGWGHLTLYRNNKFCNEFFKTKVDGFLYYKDVFLCERNLFFDEYWHNGLSDMWMFLYPEKIWDSRLFDDVQIPEISMNFVSVFHLEHSNHLIFLYENKKLYRLYLKAGKIMKEETLYAHFQKRKFMKFRTNDFSQYLIVPNKFIKARHISLCMIKYYGRSREIEKYIYNKKNWIKLCIGKRLGFQM